MNAIHVKMLEDALCLLPRSLDKALSGDPGGTAGRLLTIKATVIGAMKEKIAAALELNFLEFYSQPPPQTLSNRFSTTLGQRQRP